MSQSDQRFCNAIACQSVIESKHIFCPVHWAKLPIPIRRRLVKLIANDPLGDEILELVERSVAKLSDVEGRRSFTAAPVVRTRRCRTCGCTDDHPCEGGCRWVTDDRCSRCAAYPFANCHWCGRHSPESLELAIRHGWDARGVCPHCAVEEDGATLEELVEAGVEGGPM